MTRFAYADVCRIEDSNNRLQSFDAAGRKDTGIMKEPFCTAWVSRPAHGGISGACVESEDQIQGREYLNDQYSMLVASHHLSVAVVRRIWMMYRCHGPREEQDVAGLFIWRNTVT